MPRFHKNGKQFPNAKITKDVLRHISSTKMKGRARNLWTDLRMPQEMSVTFHLCTKHQFLPCHQVSNTEIEDETEEEGKNIAHHGQVCWL